MSNTVDFDLHGFVGVRLVDATPRELAIVKRQLGPIESPFDRRPDIVIRFVDNLAPSSRLRYLDLDGAAFSDDEFFLMRGKHGSKAKVRLPFQEIGKQCEIVCEHGLPAVPLLIDMVSVIALAKGYVPLRAAAFNFNGVGSLVTGWPQGGKAETLLGFMDRGAEYVAHEWVYLSGDGQQLWGIPRAMRLWKWQLDNLPQFNSRLGRRDCRRLRLFDLLLRSATLAVGSNKSRQGATAKSMSRAIPLIKKQLHVDLMPEKLFGQSSFARTGNLDKLFFVVTHDSPDVSVEPIDSRLVARRLAFAMEAERDDFIAAYQQFRFAFPDRTNRWIDQVAEIQQQRLLDALSDKEAYLVSHPHPVVIADIVAAIHPYCTAQTIDSSSKPRILQSEPSHELNEGHAVASG